MVFLPWPFVFGTWLLFPGLRPKLMEICKERRLTGKDKKRKKEKRKKEETSVSAYNMGFKYKPVYKARDLLHKFNSRAVKRK